MVRGTSRAMACYAIAFAAYMNARPAGAAWPTYGTNLGQTLYGFIGARVFPNADGGGTVGYFVHYGGTQTYPLIEFARVGGDGTLLASGGPFDGTLADLCSTGDGGIYLAQVYSGPTTVYRWPTTPGWPPNGVTLAPGGPTYTVRCALTSDGGCLAAWTHAETQVDLYASIARSDATVDPGWPSAGLDLGPTYPLDPARVVADDVGGGFVAWWGYNGTSNVPLMLSRVTPGGALAGGAWPASLRLAAFNRTRPPGLIRLASGDALVLSKTGSGDFSAGQFILYRSQPDGSPAPGWPIPGKIVRAASNVVGVPDLVPDGGDGAFLVWADPGSSDLRAMHVLGNGAVAPGWSSTGLRVTAPAANYVPSSGSESYYDPAPATYNFRACPDGTGGLFVGWDDRRGAGSASVWITHWTGDGIPGTGWTVDGRMVNDPALPALLGGLAPAPSGSAFVAWSEDLFFNGFYHYAYLAKVDPEIATPVLVSLVSAAARDGGVRVEWSMGGASGAAVVYRSVTGGAWERVVSAAPDGSGRIVYEDAAVVPGTRYGYRLGTTERGVETFAGEAWVDVPGLALTLEGARPNPSPGGGLAAAFTLADDSPARLEALDLAGRRVATAEVGSLGPGRHVVTLARAVPPGIYLLRLTQAGRAIDRRAAVLP